MPNIRCVVEYNGSGFHGWQVQPGLRTIQAELHQKIELVTGQELREVIASGRTDSGVHAKAQVINFHLAELPDLVRLRRGVSSLLNGEVALLSAEVVPDSFHSRSSSVSKTYQYTILNRDTPPTIERGLVWYFPFKLNVEKMRREAPLIIGRHDFSSFRGGGCMALSPVREIFESELIVDPPYLRYRVCGEGFLKQMVRNIVGTLTEIGKEKRKCDSMLEVMRALDRKAGGQTAPAYGLCLEEVKY